jgi:hypothetical protein
VACDQIVLTTNDSVEVGPAPTAAIGGAGAQGTGSPQDGVEVGPVTTCQLGDGSAGKYTGNRNGKPWMP